MKPPIGAANINAGDPMLNRREFLGARAVSAPFMGRGFHSLDFTRDFLKRHQDKLMFGSDCGCSDGHGAAISQGNNPAAARLAGKCVARETLTVLKQCTSSEVFRKITWDNAHKLLKIA